MKRKVNPEAELQQMMRLAEIEGEMRAIHDVMDTGAKKAKLLKAEADQIMVDMGMGELVK